MTASGYPKIELHVHLEGSIRAATLLDLARRNGQSLPADTVEGLAQLYRYTNFAHFIQVWLMNMACLCTAEDFRQITVDYAAEAAGFGAVYLEAIFSPCERVQRGVGWDELFTGYTEGAVEAYERYGVTVRFTPDVYRGVDVELAEQCARVAVRYRDRGVVGLGIGGAEVDRPVAPYRRAFRIARDGGLGVVPHSGETDGPESIREVLTVLEPDRIRHGVRAVEDSKLLADIAGRGIVLDVCPTSNLRIGVVSTVDEHPLPVLRAAGVRCTVNTDDPAMFDTDLGREYEIAAALGVSAEDAYLAGLAGALCDGPTRAQLAAIV